MCAPTPEALASGALGAQPEWYALLLAKALIGDRPLPVRISAPGHPNVEVTSFLAGSGRLRFVVVDDDPPRGAQGDPAGCGWEAAFAARASCRSPHPRRRHYSGVTLGGRGVAPDGSWSPRPRLPDAPNRKGEITVAIRPSSATLLSVSPRDNPTTAGAP